MQSSDRVVASPDPLRSHIGSMLQTLVTAGDDEWVEEVARMVAYRVEWVAHRDQPDPDTEP